MEDAFNGSALRCRLNVGGCRGGSKGETSLLKMTLFFILKPYQDTNGAIKGLPYMACYSNVALSVSPRHLLPPLCCNSNLLFNKQFVSDVLNASSNLISLWDVWGGSCLPPSLHKVTHACFWPCIYGCRDEDEGAILKGLQLHLNGIIRHDGWRLLFHNV